MISKNAVIAIAAIAAAACDASEPGIEVAVMTSASLGEGPLHGLVTFRDGEAGVEVSHLHLAIASVELVECPAAIPDRLVSLLIGTAYAHTKTTPLHLGVPHVIDAARTSTTHRVIGTLKPPPGDYCGLNLSFGPADPDAVGLNAQATPSAAGLTMIMAGLDWTEGTPKPLLLETKERIEARVDFVDENGLPEVLELDAEHKSAEVTYRLEPAQWIEGLSNATTDQMRAELVLRNLVKSVRANVRAN